MNDRNLHSLAGLNGSLVEPLVLHWTAPQPGEHYTQPAHMGGWQGIYRPREWSDTLKISGCSNLVVHVHGVCHGGNEDVLDVNNRCRNIRVIFHDGLAPLGNYAATIKGESRSIWVDGEIHQRAKIVEADLGNHSDQSQGRTENVVLDLWMHDGSKVRYRRINATTPTGDNLRRVFSLPGSLRAIWAWLYALLKKAGLPI